jgi:hypothetical protein
MWGQLFDACIPNTYICILFFRLFPQFLKFRKSTLQTSTEVRLEPRYRFVHVQVYRCWNKEHLYSSITVPSIMCVPQAPNTTDCHLNKWILLLLQHSQNRLKSVSEQWLKVFEKWTCTNDILPSSVLKSHPIHFRHSPLQRARAGSD